MDTIKPKCRWKKTQAVTGCSNDSIKAMYHKPFSKLNDFRNNGFLTDVSLVVNATTFQAHKIVLACFSEVFSAMFNSGMLETRNNEVVITDVRPKIMSFYLHFIYTGALPKDISVEEATDLLVCADKYQTSSLLFALDRELMSKVTINNAVMLLQLSLSFNRKKLVKSVTMYMWYNLAETIATDSWKIMLANPTSQKQTNVLLVEFYSMLRCWDGYHPTRRLDLRNFRQSWKFDKGVESFRPKRIKMCIKRRLVNFIVIFSRTPSDSVVSLIPISIIPKNILVHCKVVVSRGDEVREEQQKMLAWNPDLAHPTMGHRRVELISWDWKDPNGANVELHLHLYNASDDITHEITTTVVQEWKIDNGSPETPYSLKDAVPLSEDMDAVKLIFGETPIQVRRKLLFERSRPRVQTIKDEYILRNSSENTGKTLVRYLDTGMMPPRDKVDLSLLQAAWDLQLSDLIMYAEQAIIWDLDASNVVGIAKNCQYHATSWLTWASAQYLKRYLHRVIRWDDEEWKTIPNEFFEILIKEMRYEPHPNLLPNFIITQRRNESMYEEIIL